MTDKNHFILLGDAYHLNVFRNLDRYRDRQWYWTTLKSAKVGDRCFIYLAAPVSQIVGSFDIAAAPFLNTGMFKRFQNHWWSEVNNIQYFGDRQDLTMKSLRSLFPDWRWLSYPRGKTSIPEDILKPFLELINCKKK